MHSAQGFAALTPLSRGRHLKVADAHYRVFILLGGHTLPLNATNLIQRAGFCNVLA